MLPDQGLGGGKHRRGRRAGHPPEQLRVSINSHGFVADSGDHAVELFYPPYAEVMTRIGRERGWPPATRQQFDAARSRRGALLVGDVQEVTDKILYEHELFGYDRFLLQLTVGTMPHAEVMRAIELFGTRVAPAVRSALATRTTDS